MKYLKNISLTLLLFFINFPFSFEAFHLEQDLLILFLSVVIILSNINFLEEKVKYFNFNTLTIVLLFSTVTLLSILTPLFYGTNDFSYFRIVYFSSIQLILKYTAFGIVFLKIFKEQATLERLANMFIISCLLYLMSTFILASFTPIRDVWIELLYLSDVDVMHLSNPRYASRVGINGFAGFGQSFRFTVGVVLTIYLILTSVIKGHKENYINYLYLGSLFIGTFMYGRIGSVASSIAIGCLLLYLFFNIRTLKKAFIIISIFISLFLLLIIIGMFIPAIRLWLEWAFEMVINFSRTGRFTSVSTERLFNDMYFLPNIRSFLVGNGYFTDPITGSYYQSTDVGVLRSILFNGILPTLMTYSLLVFVFKDMYYSLKNKAGKTLIFLLIAIFIVFEIKGGIYYVFIPMLLPFQIVLRANASKKEKIFVR